MLSPHFSSGVYCDNSILQQRRKKQRKTSDRAKKRYCVINTRQEASIVPVREYAARDILLKRFTRTRGAVKRVVRRFEYVKKEFAQFLKAASEIDRFSPRDIRKLMLKISKVKKIVALFEKLIDKTSGEMIRTLVDEIHNHVESVIDAKAEAELIINKAESVTTRKTISPITSLSSPVRTTVSSPSVDSIYRIPALQLPHFGEQHEKSPSIADKF
ncbi:hypothetical protein M0804_013503 [Polistes exclamans]|nr:hypothetical protein M0804_013503 [Polistes exclamans]